MPCNFDRTLLQDYLDLEISPLENFLLEEHLCVCPECRAELEQLKMLFRSLEAPPETTLPEVLAQLREGTINCWLDKMNAPGTKTGPDQKTVGSNLSLILSSAWQSQAVWIDQAVSFVKYLPGANVAARETSKGLKISSRLAGKALLNLVKRSTVAASGRA